MTDVLIKRGNLDLEIDTGRTQCGDWSYVATAKELTEKLGERPGADSSLMPLEGAWHC